MKRFLLTLTWTLCFAAATFSGPPSLIVPESVQGDVGSFIVVRAKTEGKQVRWIPLDRGLNIFPSELLRETTATVVTASRPGVYRLGAITSLNDELSDLAVARVIVRGSGPQPEPQPEPEPGPRPQPEPGPGPQPKPISGKCWVVVIEETEQAANNRMAWISDVNLLHYLQKKGWQYRVADKDVVDASGKTPRDLAPYIDRAKTKGIPYLCVVDEKGVAHYEGRLPKSSAELLAILQKIGG